MNKWRLIKRLLLWTTGVAVFLVIALYALARIYNDELKELALAEINKGLRTKVDVREVDFTLLKRFPRASLRFSDVFVQGTMSEQDTLLTAGTVYLEFGLFDILRGNYTVKSVAVVDAKVMIKRNAQGEDNYRFWKETEGEKGDFRFSVDELAIENSTLEWADLQMQLWAEFGVEEARLTGVYAKDVLETNLRFDGQINTWQMPWSPKLENKRLEMEGNFNVDGQNQSLRFNPLSLVLDDFPLEITGAVDTGTKPALNLSLLSPNADLATVMAILPREIDESMADYAISGRADLKATLQGVVQNGKSPDIHIELPVRKGNFVHRPSGAELQNLNTDIQYTLKEGVSAIEIRNAEGAFKGNPFSVKGTIINPTAPRFDLECRGEFPLAEVFTFFRMDSALTADGLISLSGKFAGAIADIKNISSAEWAALKINGTVRFEDVALSTPELSVDLEKMQGLCEISDNALRTNGLNLTINKNEFLLDGELTGLLPYLLSDAGVLTISANCRADRVNLDDFFIKGKTSESQEINTPGRVSLRLDLDWKELVYRQFKAEEILTGLTYSGGVLNLNPLSLRTCDGELTASLKMTDKLNRFDFSALGNLEDVDLHLLFGAFENFGQTFLTKENLKGKLRSGFALGFQTDKKLVMHPKTISCIAQVKVENGELIQLNSLRNISDYLKKKKLLSVFVDADGLEKKLKHVTFETLENTIRVKDGVIVFPFMEIKSSALEITVEGQQTFDNKIDYTFGFYLRDVLMKKKRQEGEVDDGLGKTFFIQMAGTTENPIFSIDKEAAKNKRKKDIEAEKDLIKQILKEEIRGSAEEPKPSLNDAKPATIDVKWEETQPAEEKTEEPKKKKKRSLKDLLGDDEEEDF